MATLRTLTPPPFYPVSLAEAKDWCRVDSDDTSQDAVIRMIIAALTEQAENVTKRSYVQRSYELLLDGFVEVIRLPRPPLLTVDYVKYYDTNGTLQTISAAEYSVSPYDEPGILEPAYNESWPFTRDIRNAVLIGYTAGYAPGSPTTEVGYQEVLPDNLKLWLHARVATMYENREQLIRNNLVNIPRDFADGLLDNLIVDMF
jgi:uncharacterized phiE125 gp8 family phage protein